MPPAKSRANHEDAKSETPSSKEKNGHGAPPQQSNGKPRRVAGAAASQLRDVTNAASLPPATAIVLPPAAPETASPGVS